MNKLRMMIRIRLFEERVTELKLGGEITGPVHTCIGQEAICAGICMALAKTDYIIGNHRSHGHLIAKGTDLKLLMGQILEGNGRSMHVTDVSVGAICSTAIVGSGLSLACGVAFGSKFWTDEKITCVFFGDGAVNEGSFYESLNIAYKWKLTVIFVIENNGVAVTTTMDEELIYRAYPFNVNRQKIYGQDVDEVFNATIRAVSQIKTNKYPALIEATTMRFPEHQVGEAYEKMKETGYRDNNEVKYWIEHRDPITLYSEKLIRENVLQLSRIDEIWCEESELIDDAVKFAKEKKS
jgi:TPP-dependent pyruvate/acetoin dehydrogenase alpha subunit